MYIFKAWDLFCHEFVITKSNENYMHKETTENGRLESHVLEYLLLK